MTSLGSTACSASGNRGSGGGAAGGVESFAAASAAVGPSAEGRKRPRSEGRSHQSLSSSRNSCPVGDLGPTDNEDRAAEERPPRDGDVPADACSVSGCSAAAAVRILSRPKSTGQSTASAPPVPADAATTAHQPGETLCLLHYYASDSVRLVPADSVEPIADATAQQLPDVQRLFASVFVEVRNRLLQARNDEAAASARARKRPRLPADSSDPLSILDVLHSGNRRSSSASAARPMTKKKNKKPPLPTGRSSASAKGGGFLPPEVMPERLLRTQREQALHHEQLQRRLDRAAAQGAANANANATKPPPFLSRPGSATARRKPSRRSVWNAVLEESRTAEKAPPPLSQQPPNRDTAPPSVVEEPPVGGDGVACSSCGSTNVAALGTHSNRNDAQRKGETWGNKDRGDEVWTRYQCNHCGKQWNEEG